MQDVLKAVNGPKSKFKQNLAFAGKQLLIYPHKEQSKQEVTLDAIFQRTSVRAYSKKPVKKKAIKKILKAAMQAPSAGNQQPWEFIVVTDPDLIAKLSACSPYAKPAAKAPVSIVMLMHEEGMRFSAMVQQDMGACAQNILLEATELGLGSVWQGLYPEPERMEYVSTLFDIPEGIAPFAIISLGYPKKGKLPKQTSRYDKNRIGWNKCVVKPYAAKDEQQETAAAAIDEQPFEPAEQAPAADEPAAANDQAEKTPAISLTGWRSASNAALQ